MQPRQAHCWARCPLRAKPALPKSAAVRGKAIVTSSPAAATAAIAAPVAPYDGMRIRASATFGTRAISAGRV